MQKDFKYGCLRALRLSDAEEMLEWMHDKNVASMFQADFFSMGINDVINFIEKSHEDNASYHFAVADADDSYMGTISLKNVDITNSCAEYAISMRSCAHGTGLAKVATESVLRYAFVELGINRVYLNVRSDNARARRFYNKIGFIEEGRARDAIATNDGFVDLIWMSFLAREADHLIDGHQQILQKSKG